MKLEAALAALCDHLRGAGFRFAVVGGLAASARGEVRFTRDVDVVVAANTDADAESCVFRLQSQGYLVRASVEQEATGRLATARLQSPDGSACDLIFATSGIETEVIDSAESIELFPGQIVPTATVEALIAMKVLSSTPERPRDLGDILAMLSANPSLDRARVVSLLEKIELRGFGRQQSLVPKWNAILTTLNRD